jgi:hypothetical protein
MAAKVSDAWTVLDHGPIERINERLWRVEGALPGMSLRRVMTVAKRENGGLVVHSAMALRPSEQAELEAWGTPEVLVVPSAYHRLDAPAYKKRYPGLRVYAPRAAIGKVRAVVPVDGSYQDYPADAVVELRALPGVSDREGVMLVRSEGRLSVIVNDIVMNMDRKRDLLGFLFTTVLGSAPGPRISRLVKLALVTDRAALRAELQRLAQLPELENLIVGHEKISRGNAAARQTLEKAATYL